MHIKHITLRVRDIQKSIDFYKTLTGLKVSRFFEHGTTTVAFMANKEGKTEIELLHVPNGQMFEGKGMFICFQTDKLEEKHKFAEEKGLNPSPIHDPGDKTSYFYVYDPDGISIQLRHFPK